MIRTSLAAALLSTLLATAASAEVKIALDTPADLEKSGTYVWVNAFAEHLRANGMEVTEFERGALGGEAERLDQVSSGLLEVSMGDTKSPGSISSLVWGYTLPFLFSSSAELNAAVGESGIIDQINEETTEQGVRFLAFVGLGVPNGILNTKKPIERLEDMSDMRFRALDERQIDLYKAWGTTGTIISWNEVPNALQTGVADGYLNTPVAPLLFGHTGFIKFFTDARFSPSTRAAIASEAWWQGLSDDEKAIVSEAVDIANAANVAWTIEQEKVLDELRAAGVTVTTLSPEERERFRQASLPVYDSGLLTPEELTIWTEAAGN
jgi:TRAP-type C4-dicarboxylate transport system substrate-binding protein